MLIAFVLFLGSQVGQALACSVCYGAKDGKATEHMAVAIWVLHTLLALKPEQIILPEEIHPDARVVAFALLIVLASAFLLASTMASKPR